MINYSIVMRSVNANLFEINQAKGRIKMAQKMGQTPEQADLDLVATEKQNAFAIAQYADVMTIEKFARHIATHGCVYSRADISTILYMAVDCMREQLLEGKKIRLGDLGDFSVNLSSKGAETADKFTAQNITGVNVVWDPGMEFKNLLADAEFNLVASRNAQAAVLKEIKAGQTTVDLTVPADPTDPSGGDGNGGDSGSDGGSDNGGTGSDGGGSSVQKYTLTVTSADSQMGSVTGGGEYEAGTQATVTAVANSGYQFKQWSDGNTSATRSVTVNSNLTLTATFEAESSGGEDPEEPPFS